MFLCRAAGESRRYKVICDLNHGWIWRLCEIVHTCLISNCSDACFNFSNSSQIDSRSGMPITHHSQKFPFNLWNIWLFILKSPTVTHFIPWESKIHVSSSHFKSSMIVPYALYCTWFTPGVSYPDFPYNQPNAFEIDKQIHVFRYWLIWELSVNMIQCREALQLTCWKQPKLFFWSKSKHGHWMVSCHDAWLYFPCWWLKVVFSQSIWREKVKHVSTQSREAEQDVQPISTCVLCCIAYAKQLCIFGSIDFQLCCWYSAV